MPSSGSAWLVRTVGNIRTLFTYATSTMLSYPRTMFLPSECLPIGSPVLSSMRTFWTLLPKLSSTCTVDCLDLVTRPNVYLLLDLFGFAFKYLELRNLYCSRKGDGGYTQRIGALYYCSCNCKKRSCGLCCCLINAKP